ncbi:MAG: hypothetical protein Q9170_006258 [Blastenia crenularia]
MFVRRAILCLLTAKYLAWAAALPAPPSSVLVNDPTGGDATPDDDVCQDYKTCSSKGHTAWQQLLDKVGEAQPIDIADTTPIFEKDYGCQFMSSDDPIPTVQQDLENHGFGYEWLEAFGVYSINPATGAETEETAYTNMFYTSKGLIVADENFREKDEQKTLHWSELMYHAWKVAMEHDDEAKAANTPAGHPGSGPFSALQTVVRVRVANDKTQAVIQTIRKAKQDWGVDDPSWHQFTSGPDTALWFTALLGTIHLQGVVWLLRDHAAEIGKKVITEIWVRWAGAEPDIWINIGTPT